MDKSKAKFCPKGSIPLKNEVIGLNQAAPQRAAGVYVLTVLGVLLAGFYLPFLRFPGGMVLLVVTALTASYSTALFALAVLAVSGAGLTMLLATPVPLSMVLEYGLLGIIPALGFKNRVSAKSIMAVMMTLSPLLLGASLALGYYEWGLNPMEFPALVGVELDSPAEKEFLRVVTMLLPADYAASAYLASLLGFFMAQEALRQRGLTRETLPFSRFHLPWYAIWGLIVGLAMALAGAQWYGQQWTVVGANILLLMFFIFVSGGLALAIGFYRRLTWARSWKLLSLGFAVLYWPVSLASLAAFGLLDSLINWRERYQPPQDEEG